MSDDHEPVVFELIRDEIARSGPMTFARFMELALYAPERGYYMRDADRIGARGDFYTSSNVDTLFGTLIADQLLEMFEAVGETPVTIVEAGAGRGALAYDILRAMSGSARESAMRYVIVERSPAMTARQRKLLEPFVARGVVSWSDDLPAESFAGCVLSNELVDAFPVHRVVQRDGLLREIYVDVTGSQLVDREAEPSTPDLTAYLERLGVRLADGQQAEINLSAMAWIRSVGRRLRRGYVMTVDYGYPADELYAPHRRRGTVLAYYRHRATDALYERVGRQDLTPHVDFTSLALAGREAGLEVDGFTDQMSFLLGLGAHEVAERLLAETPDEAAHDRTLEGIRGLLDPHGMGRTFKVLIQRKGMGARPLRGLSFAARSGERLAVSGPHIRSENA